MQIDAMAATKYAAAMVAVSFVICALLLIGFRRGRLRGYNIYVVFSVALLGSRGYGQLETGDFGGWWGAVVWINLAVCGVWGIVGMIGIAASDATVYTRRHAATEDRRDVSAVPDDDLPVHDSRVLAELTIIGEQTTATGQAGDDLTEARDDPV